VRFETANAFRTALEQRLKNEAQATGVAPLRLRNRVAFERFLGRLATSESSGWVLKAHLRWSCPLASRPERRRTSTLAEPTTLLALSAVSVAVSEFYMAPASWFSQRQVAERQSPLVFTAGRGSFLAAMLGWS